MTHINGELLYCINNFILINRMKYILFIVILLYAKLGLAQAVDFNVNVGLDHIAINQKFNNTVDSPFNSDYSYAVSSNDKMISVWDTRNKIITKNIRVTEITAGLTEEFPNVSFISTHFIPNSSQMMYTVSMWNDKTESQAFWIVFYDYVEDKEVKKILFDTYYENVIFLNEHELILQQGGFFKYSLSIFKYDTRTQEKEFIREHSFDKGLNYLQWQRINKQLYYTLIGNQKVGIFDVVADFEHEEISYPEGLDIETNSVASVHVTKDLLYVVLKNSNRTSITRITDNTVVASDIATEILNQFPVGIIFNKDSSSFLYEQDERTTKKTKIIINEHHIKKKESKAIGEVYNTKDAILSFLYTNPLVTTGYDVDEIVAFLNFQKTCKALLNVGQEFGLYKNFWVSAFDNGTLGVYDLETSSYEIWNNLGLPNLKVSAMEFYKNKILLIYSGYNKAHVIALDLKDRKITNKIEINDAYGINSLKISEKEDLAIFGVKRTQAGDEETLLLDMENFRFKPKHLFEDFYYNQVYSTGDGKLIAGYNEEERTTQLYDRETLKFIRLEVGLIAIHKNKKYTLEFEIQPTLVKQEETYKDCHDCEDGFKIIPSREVLIDRPTGNFLITNSRGKTKKIKLIPDLSDFLFNDWEAVKITCEGPNVQFTTNGKELFKIQLKTGNSSVQKEPLSSTELLLQGLDDKKIVLKGFGYNKSTYTDYSEGEEYEFTYGNDLYYAPVYDPNKNTYLEATYKNIPFDYKYLQPTIIALVNLGQDIYPKTVGIIEDDENGFGGYAMPQLFDNGNINYENENDENPDPNKNSFFSFFNVFTKQESSLHFDKNPFEQEIVFHNVAGRTFVSTSTVKRTQELKLFTENDSVISRVTSENTFGNWKEKYHDSPYKTIRDDNGINQIINRETGKRLASAYFNLNSDFFVSTTDNYYVANQDIFEYLWFSRNNRVYRPEQFDLQYNRPDLVLSVLGMAKQGIVDAYKTMYQKRLKKFGLNQDAFKDTFHEPELAIMASKSIPTITKENQLLFKVVLKDTETDLKQLQVWNNDVPINASSDSEIDDRTRQKTLNVTVPLINGSNKIQVSVLNNKGAESKKETLFVQKVGTIQKPNLYILTIGVSDFQDNDYDLKYAAKDALDVANTFKESQAFQEVFTKILIDDAVSEKTILEAASFFNSATVDDVVILFVASHGLLNADYQYFLATPEMNFEKPSQGGIPYEIFDGLLSETSSLKKIILLDACHSGEVDVDEVEANTTFSNASNDISHIKAVRGAKPIAAKKSLNDITSFSKNLFADLRRGNGTNVISSAGGLELAFEGDQWNNGLFTYSLLHGLRSGEADTNQDGQVMLSELQEYTFKRVSKLSKGRQTPTFRIQNIAVDYRIW